MRLARRLLLALWAGVLVTLGAIVAPVLFVTLADRQLAGRIAGELFRVATWGSVASAALLLALAMRAPRPDAAARSVGVVGPALLLGASEWLVRPLLEAARAAGGAGGAAFAAWHGVSSALYLAATLWLVAELVRELRA